MGKEFAVSFGKRFNKCKVELKSLHKKLDPGFVGQYRAVKMNFFDIFTLKPQQDEEIVVSKGCRGLLEHGVIGQVFLPDVLLKHLWELFTLTNVDGHDIIDGVGPSVSLEDISSLLLPVQEKEVKDVVFQMQLDKSRNLMGCYQVFTRDFGILWVKYLVDMVRTGCALNSMPI